MIVKLYIFEAGVPVHLNLWGVP